MILSRVVLLFFLLAFGVNPLLAEEYSISLEKASLKEGPSFLRKTVGFLKYGDLVTKTETKGVWVYIKSQTISGWCHNSCISSKKSILADIGEGEQIAKAKYKDEVTLAGKGFSSEHERLYKEKNPKISYKDVDKLETFSIEGQEIKHFAKEGKLNVQL